MYKPVSLMAAALFVVASGGSFAKSVKIDSYTFGGLSARSIGPAVTSGRIASIDGIAGEVLTLYVGAASGGVWKSEDGGIRFKPIFDDYPQSIGAVRIDPGNKETVWVGTGESWVRNSVGIGNGVYKTSDGGETWAHLGLEDSEHISAIRIDGDHGEIVYVCALGHAWDSNEERGVFKTSDAGKTWNKVLYVDQNTGCADLDIDPQSPNILYAAMWEFRRSPDFFSSGGKGSGLYRSMDGGQNWERLNKGLPRGELGRIAVAVAPSRPSTVYATVESENTALYRSDDFGSSWQELDHSMNIQMRPFYFSELVVDPSDHLRVYKPGFTTTYSTDGGETFSSMLGEGFSMAVHPDHHALWINPENPQQLVLGTDGGVYISRDRTTSWTMVKTLPVSQFYHISADNQRPYQVYGGLQDNGSWAGPSSSPGGIEGRDWDSVGFGDGFWVFVDPHDDSIIYSEYQGGKFLRVNRTLGEVKHIAPFARDGEERLRFNWNTAMHLSQSNPGTIYYGSQYLHRSRDRGESWQTISPDLTSDDPQLQRQADTGGLTIDNSTAENNATIYTISESPRNGDLIWVGSDDGLVHLTRDGGANWIKVSQNLPGVPKGTWVSRVEASPLDEATAFVTFDGHRRGDKTVYVYRTIDYGASWTSLATDDIESFAWVIKQDPVNPKLLFLGTELGLYISIDGGAQWARFKENLPKVAIHDIVIQARENDLVLATHGRGVYIIDDITALRHLTEEVLKSEVAILPSRPAVMVAGGVLQSFGAGDEFVGLNPPQTAMITYYLKKRHLFGDLKINIYDRNDNLITTIAGSKRRGINRVGWPMRLNPPKFPAAASLSQGFFGPRVPEGEYRVELIKDQVTLESSVRLVPDPRSPHSAEDRQLQQKVALELYAALSDLTYTVESVDELSQQAQALASAAKKSDAAKMNSFVEKMNRFAGSVAARGTRGWLSGEKQLRERLGSLYAAISGYNGRPSQTQLERQQQLDDELTEAQYRAASLLQAELPKLNKLLARRDLEPLVRISRDEWNQREGLTSSMGPMSKYFRRIWLPLMPAFITH